MKAWLWLSAGNVEFLGPLLATCLHDTPARLQMICFYPFRWHSIRCTGIMRASAIDGLTLSPSTERSSKHAMYQSVFIFFLCFKVVKNVSNNWQGLLTRQRPATPATRVGSGVVVFKGQPRMRSGKPPETSVVLSSSRLWLRSSKSCGNSGKPSLDSASSRFRYLTCRLSGVLLALLGSRESRGIGGLFSSLRSLTLLWAGGWRGRLCLRSGLCA